jgi:Flp pilus assembly protein CpaB
MKRWLIGLACLLLVASVATAVLYLKGRDGIGECGNELLCFDDEDLVTVVVAKRRIEANQRLDPLVEQGMFEVFEIPRAALAEGAVTQINQLEGTRTTAPIWKHEQVLTSRLVAAQS